MEKQVREMKRDDAACKIDFLSSSTSSVQLLVVKYFTLSA